jgi:serine/threonine protein kinase
MDCGFLFQPGQPGEVEGGVNFCPNPACGVGNLPGERHCRRCGDILPTLPGTVLHGRYKVKKLLAMGGLSAVYLAEDTRGNNREVAVKDMICPDLQEPAVRLEFCRREAKVLRSLAGLPIVPRLYDLIEEGPTPLLVMEYIPGQDLLCVLEANGNRGFPLDRVIEWFKLLCDLLAHMHAQSPPLLYRDLGPSNILLAEDGRSIRVVGFARAGYMPRDRAKDVTRVYTEGYAPPEQIVGIPEPRSDLFAMACTMYQLATGKPPEGSYTAREIEAQLNDGSLAAEQRWFFELLRINLADDVHERYSSAQEIKADLERRQVTREVPCPQCGRSNPVRHPYCRACCQPLTELSPLPCPSCGGRNRMGSRHCVHCAARLR